MTDITMCSTALCPRMNECARHPASGAQPAVHQYYQAFGRDCCKDNYAMFKGKETLTKV